MMYTLHLKLSEQILYVFDERNHLVCKYLVSTAANGPGEQLGSEKTPRGWHKVRAKMGHDMPENTVFIRRRPTGEIYDKSMRQKYPQRDWILTRILWLSGLELGKNRLGNVDTMRRYIYIHGVPDDINMGVPSSHGCVRMHNKDVMTLFDLIDVGTRLLIE